MKKITFILVLLSFLSTNAQTNNGIDNKYSIKVNPHALIDVYGSYSYRIGTEVKIYRNLAASIEIGNYFRYGKNDGLRENSKGYIIKPEFKVYLNPNNLSSGDYISLEYQYKEIGFDYNDSIKNAPAPTYSKEYHINKVINCITLKLGNLKVYKKGFLFEYFFGAGVRICRGNNTLTDFENDNVLTGENHGSDISWGQRNINYILPNLSLGFKIGYSFK